MTGFEALSAPPQTTGGVMVPLPSGCKFHIFLSHYQASGGDQMDALLVFRRLQSCIFRILVPF